jgi:Ca2+-binding EF-hand superfamily protein
MRQTCFLRSAGPLAALILAFAAAGCGSSSPGLKEGIDGAFIRAAATWDLNHDGNVTCDEWRQYAASVFKDADLNHDGKLTREEFDRLAKIDRLFLLANFDYYDTDRKGHVTLADLVDHPNPAFKELDKDNTCVIKTYQLRAAITDEPKSTNPGTPAASGSSPGQRH